ncbi:hypothetical protein R5R35_013947 [Gryllus longicercus]|uniref:G-protein coupled receptors family 1 profile domain-containing protein n=1 Tax=Gryllus longicercus TaxID=2509291 RepID=A0AAN9V0Q1_9ORTH
MSAKDRRLLQMILVIFGAFLVCYLPITVAKTFFRNKDWHALNIAAYVLVYLASCVNPIIYVMSSEYRQAYTELLCCRRGSGAGGSGSGGQDGAAAAAAAAGAVGAAAAAAAAVAAARTRSPRA